MKKITLLTAGLFLAILSYCQVNYPIPQDETSEWRIWNSTWDPPSSIVQSSDARVFVSGDTIINGKVYSILLASGLTTYEYQGISNSWSFENEFYTFIRTDSARTWIYRNGQEELLYDFTLQAGDTLPETSINWGTVVISSIDSVLVDGKYLKRFNIYDSINEDLLSTWYIEGIGHEYGLIEPMYMMLDNGNFLECYAENGAPVFNPQGEPCDLTVLINEWNAQVNLLKVYPNPSRGIFNISYSSAEEKEVLIKILGLRGDIIYRSLWNIKKGLNEKFIDLSSASNGIFLIELEDGINITRGKLSLTK